MVIWTIMPEEIVFAGVTDEASTKEIEYAGVILEVQETGKNTCKVVRLISTSPNNYLNPKFQPGMIVKYQPIVDAL